MRLLSFMLLLFSLQVQAIDIKNLTNKEAASGLKEAMNRGTQQAIQSLGKENGFMGNERVKIPLPESLGKLENAMRRFGMGSQVDELVLTMNRAAEGAVPEARDLFVDAIRSMTIEDAKGILTGGDTSATDFFQRKMTPPLTAKFLPVVKRSTEKVGVAQKYNELAGQASRLGLIDESQSSIENYITQKTLAGLFLMIADEEKAIRAKPVEQGSKLLTKVFGSILGK